VPEIPQNLTGGYFDDYKFDKFVVPVGLTYNEIKPVTIDLARIGAVGVYGREGFGKSNFVRIVMSYLQRNVFNLPCQAYLVDGYDRQLAEFEAYGFIAQSTVDCADFEEIIQKFSDAASARMDILRAGGNLDGEPLLLCIVQNIQIFAASAVSRAAGDQLKQLLNDAKQLRICFIFSNVDNNNDYAASDIMKMARDFPQYFLLDDINNVKLFGASRFNSSDLKPFKKALALGDGYSFNSRDGIEKIKLVKCDRG
jgi:S-DNA-T family DNA segregation ATPase FtsK/SpoIIIE